MGIYFANDIKCKSIIVFVTVKYVQDKK